MKNQELRLALYQVMYITLPLELNKIEHALSRLDCIITNLQSFITRLRVRLKKKHTQRS